MRINSLTHAGGVNSIENFARSWQRAVAFHEITPTRGSFALAEDESQPDLRRRHAEERPSAQPRSLIRQQLEQQGRPEMAVHDSNDDVHPLTPNAASPSQVLSASPNKDIFSHASHLSSPFSTSFGGTYGSLSAHTNETTRDTATRLFLEQQASGIQEPDKDREPMLVKRVEEEDGTMTLQVVGQSTIYQTILNSTNVLIGVGLLSLPLGIKYAGWVVGLSFLCISAVVTGYTARLLGKCLTVDRNLITFSDLAYIAFGSKAQVLIGLLFTLELIAACVALFVLFADSLDLLIPGWGVLEFKIVCGVIMLPLSFVPLRFLGYTSSLGIISCLMSMVNQEKSFECADSFSCHSGSGRWNYQTRHSRLTS
ncbi:hypothetical protein MMC10_007986 [Thelotrema lepadinum]|nr:hypothetical protein [Thelotrema lepadinum]